MLNPHEIANKEFNRQMRGYSIDEVDDYLDELVVDIQASYRELTTAKAKLEMMQDKLSKYETLEKTLNETLIVAQETAKTIKENARKEAELILQEAKESARGISLSAHSEHADIEQKLQQSRLEFENYRRRMLNFMETQMISFDAMTKDVTQRLAADNHAHTNLEYTQEFTKPIYDFPEETPLG